MALLEVKNLGIQFGGLRAVDDFSMQIEAGELYGLIGPNGAGKTTLFRILSGQEEATSGSISMPKHIEIGYLSQNLELEQDKSCLENLTLVFSHLIEMEEQLHQ